MSEKEFGSWGRGDLMALAAVRYCLGRQTYIVSDCADWLIQQWPNFHLSTQVIIKRDIEQEFARDDEVRSRLNAVGLYKPLGDDCDRAQWERVRMLWEQESTP